MKNLLMLFLVSVSCFSQTLDITFNANHQGLYNEYMGYKGFVNDDGTIITFPLGAGFIQKFHDDSSLDNSFAAVAVNSADFFFKGSNGKFGVYGSTSPEIYFYNADGSAIQGFVQPTLTGISDPSIMDVVWQADGKIMLVGDFLTVNGYGYRGVARLNADGSVDTTFNPGTGAYGIVFTIAQQTDGKYIIGGDFGSYNGVTRYEIVRINSDGSIDSTFYNYNSASYGFSDLGTGIRNIEVQANGKILVSGSNFYEGGSSFTSQSVTRLNANGSRDNTFACTISTTNPMEYLLILSNGKYLIFDSGDHKLYRLNSNGTQDNSFTYNNTNIWLSDWNALHNCPDNKVLINSSYTSSTGLTRKNIHRINADGTIDLTFNPQQSVNAACTGLKVLNNNKIIVTATGVTTYNDTPCSKNILRLSENGELDASFNIDSQISLSGNFIIKEQNDNKILLSIDSDTNQGTSSLQVNNVPKAIIRINENGTLDTSFNLLSGVAIYDYELLNDGKILASVNNGTPQIFRFNSDGSLDTGFTPMSNLNGKTRFTKFSDGSLFMIGLNSFGNLLLKKLNPDGTINSSFNCTLTNVKGIARQSSGKYLVSYQNNVVRIDDSGTIDPLFTNISVGLTSDKYNPVFVNSEGKIFIFRITTVGNPFNNTSALTIYSSDGILQQTINDYYDRVMAKQGCDNILMSTRRAIDLGGINDILRFKIFTGLITPPPTGVSPQPFVADYTLNNLVISGADITWYSSQSQCGMNIVQRLAQPNDVPLPLDTPLVNGTTYYASQTLGGVESTYRLPILVSSTLTLPEKSIDKFWVNNPIDERLKLFGKEPFYKITIYQLNGVQLLANDFNQEVTAEIDVHESPMGFYVMKIWNSYGIYSVKIIKR